MKKSTNKILLIEPPFYRLFKDSYSLDKLPLSLYCLARAINKYTSHIVKIYNADFNTISETQKNSYFTGIGFINYLNNLNDLTQPIWKEIELTIRKTNPNIVGITAKSPTIKSVCNIAKICKGIDKDITVIVGGPHVSNVGVEVLECQDIDYSIKGEGENTIVELVQSIEKNGPLNDINGLIYRNNGQIIENDPREYIKNLDSYSQHQNNIQEILIDFKHYPLSAFQSIMTSRGCSFNCFFCGSREVWGRKVRIRSPLNIIQEIKFLQKIGLQTFHFADDTFGLNKNHLEDLCHEINKNCPKIKWSCEMHVSLINDKTLSLMKKSGCYSILLGIESGNNEILRNMRKQITIEEALNAAKIIKRNGILLRAFFMVGMPQETEESIQDTITAMKAQKYDEILYSIFTPYPGTEAFEFCKKNSLISNNYDVSLYNHQSPLNSFCLNIEKEKFRKLISKIEVMVDRINYINKIKQIFGFKFIWKIKEYGLRQSIKLIVKTIIGK